ncbi:MAG TPA: ABC transporter ATP-binding protein [Pyrinomonadaceae bacterium]|nr:ABC transporter ATP-binding protein [Pyrinomonadaceae bacterium]
MSDVAIRCENLSKQYRIGSPERYKTLREAISTTARAPFRRLRNGSRNGNGYIWALDSVSLEINRGEVVGIIGLNGAGKSTLLKILSRITGPTRGRADIYGRVGSLLEVGTGFHPELTGRENIYLNGAILGMRKSEIERRFDEIVAFAEVEKFLDTPVKRYSSGMYVRLAFAVAAHLEPEILVVDEVLSVGDASFQKKSLARMGKAASGGRSVLFVSHNLAAINSLCSRCLLMDQGALVLSGSPGEVTSEYQARVHEKAQNGGSLDEVERYGSGKARFTAVKIQSCGTPNYVETGGDLEIELEISSRANIEDANVAAIIYDVSGVRLLDVNTALKGTFLSLQRGEQARVKFRLRDLLLKPGTYMLGVWLGRGGIEEIDSVKQAASFSVEAPHTQAKHSEVFPGPYQCRFDHSMDKVGISR